LAIAEPDFFSTAYIVSLEGNLSRNDCWQTKPASAARQKRRHHHHVETLWIQRRDAGERAGLNYLASQRREDFLRDFGTVNKRAGFAEKQTWSRGTAKFSRDRWKIASAQRQSYAPELDRELP